MIRFTELVDGTYRLTVSVDTESVRYVEESRFEKIENDSSIPEKDGGYRFEINRDE